ncbi:hypothetical protein M514_13086 [Trichuris suis]|uniref:Uncharacterized protein n=1 Tax=Trichuris suis TaxID=68888 RepID=A0A085NQN9_9BILA|nr:hypothetical protein M513_13086 [Trichuris suis]KFD71785.1 hypothetical protein M514_13086 [Trichuris suis]
MSLFPRPLVPEISVCSPPKSCPVQKQVIKPSTKRASSERCLVQREKESKPQFGMTCKPPSSLARSGLGGDIATLKSQLNKQQTEISEMKRMIENLVDIVGPAKIADRGGKSGTSSSSQCLDVKSVDFGCQVESACPHCGVQCHLNGKLPNSGETIAEELKRENGSVYPSGIGADVQKAVQEKPPSSFCVVSQTEKQFVNEMIKAARKWLQTDDNLDDIDETPGKSCDDPEIKATNNPTNGNGMYGQVNIGKSSRKAPSDFPPSAESGSLSMEINALAMRYLDQNGDEPPGMRQRRGVHFESPNYTLTRRQQVVTEEVSMGGLGGPPEVSLSSREYLERHGVIGPNSRPQHRVQQPRFAYDEDIPKWYPPNRPQRWPEYYPDKYDQYDNACYRRYRNC